MSFSLSPEHEAFRRIVRDFASTRIAPHIAEWDKQHHFPVDVVKDMGELGLFGLTAPEEFGGSGGDFTSLCVAIEEISRVDQAMGITLEAGVGLGINPILTYGSQEQKNSGCRTSSPVRSLQDSDSPNRAGARTLEPPQRAPKCATANG